MACFMILNGFWIESYTEWGNVCLYDGQLWIYSRAGNNKEFVLGTWYRWFRKLGLYWNGNGYINANLKHY